ncbi:MAG: hypothetical protein WBK12_03080 [Tenuifilaceae bacterium]
MKTIRSQSDRFLLILVLSSLFIFFLILTILSKGAYGGGDDITHYLIARYAYKHPINLLSHWGKPFYTLLISPFAQFGFLGSKIFNLIVGIATSYLCYRIAKHFHYPKPYLIPIFVLFTPVYSIMVLSGMTEVLFSFILVLSVFLFLRKSYILAAIVLSFLPFVRNEGVVVFPIFIFLYILQQQYRAIPFLFLGFLAYSIIGYFAFDDFFWVINQLPYGGSSVYGSGSLMHFIINTDKINGYPLGILFLMGAIGLLIQWGKERFCVRSNAFFQITIILLPAMAYYSAHSFMWWIGGGGSFGLVRVMAGITPLMVIVSLNGISILLSMVKSNKIQHAIVLGITILALLSPFHAFNIPLGYDGREKLMQEAVIWFKNSEYKDDKVLFCDPLFVFYAGIDPYDGASASYLWWDNKRDYPQKTENEVIIWDAQFAPNEHRMPKHILMESPYLKLVKSCEPTFPFITFGGYNYEVLIFSNRIDTLSNN